GASIPDMDHENNKNKINIMFVSGIIISLLLVILKGSMISGLIIIFLAITFYYSKHRGLTHSFAGIIVICFLLLFMMMGFFPVVSSLAQYANYALPNNLSIFLILSLLGYFVVSRKVLTYYVILLAICLFLAPVNIQYINWQLIFIMLFTGAVSHLILDLFTPSGLAVFWPLTDRVFHRNLAAVFIVIWLFLAVSYVYAFGHIVLTYQPLLNYII
ncbi:MAG: hypothetical protein BZ138_03685, partial [Methanosphaera sp. rholeuAM270]